MWHSSGAVQEEDVSAALLRYRGPIDHHDPEPYLIGNNVARNVATGEKNARLENLIMFFLVGLIVVVFGVVLRTVGSHLADDIALVVIVVGVMIIAVAYGLFLLSGYRLTGVPASKPVERPDRLDD